MAGSAGTRRWCASATCQASSVIVSCSALSWAMAGNWRQPQWSHIRGCPLLRRWDGLQPAAGLVGITDDEVVDLDAAAEPGSHALGQSAVQLADDGRVGGGGRGVGAAAEDEINRTPPGHPVRIEPLPADHGLERVELVTGWRRSGHRPPPGI